MKDEEIDWSKLTLPAPPLSFYLSPKPNWRISFGDSTDTYFHYYIKNPPNRFQRWMIRKVFGIKFEPI